MGIRPGNVIGEGPMTGTIVVSEWLVREWDLVM